MNGIRILPRHIFTYLFQFSSRCFSSGSRLPWIHLRPTRPARLYSTFSPRLRALCPPYLGLCFVTSTTPGFRVHLRLPSSQLVSSVATICVCCARERCWGRGPWGERYIDVYLRCWTGHRKCFERTDCKRIVETVGSDGEDELSLWRGGLWPVDFVHGYHATDQHGWNGVHFI